MSLPQKIFVAFAALIFAFCAACSDPAARLPVYDSVPPFQMTDSHGRIFDSSSLRGKVWVADFIYTNCPAECPMMSAKMHRLEKQVRGQDNVRLVSISVDPARDTPEALTRFAKRYGGPTNQWIFLTGTPETVHQIAFKTFHVGDVLGRISPRAVSEAKSQNWAEHSTKFVLVDRSGRIRGYYSSLGQDDLAALMRDLRALAREHS